MTSLRARSFLLHIGCARISEVFLAAADNVYHASSTLEEERFHAGVSRQIVLALLLREKLRGVWLDLSKEGTGGLAARALLMRPTSDEDFNSAVRAYRTEHVPYLKGVVYLSEATDAVRHHAAADGRCLPPALSAVLVAKRCARIARVTRS